MKDCSSSAWSSSAYQIGMRVYSHHPMQLRVPAARAPHASSSRMRLLKSLLLLSGGLGLMCSGEGAIEVAAAEAVLDAEPGVSAHSDSDTESHAENSVQDVNQKHTGMRGQRSRSRLPGCVKASCGMTHAHAPVQRCCT